MADTATQPKTEQAQEKVQEVAGQAKEQAQQVAGQASSQVRTQVDQRSTQAGEQITSQVQDVRSISQQLREQGKDKPAELVDKAADKAESLGSYLTQSDADRILHDVEDFARQRPWAVIAGGIALGVAASRFLKASSNDRYYSRQQSSYNGGTQGYAPTTPLTTRPPVTPTAHPADGVGVGSAGIPVAPTGDPAGTERRYERDTTAGGVVDPSGTGGPPIPPPSTAGGL